MGQDIRIRFSGLVIFTARAISILTGMIFAVVIVRSLSQSDYGAWTNILGVIGTFGLAAGIFPFWSARYTARGFKGAMKLGLTANLAVGLAMTIVASFVGPVLAAAASTLSLYYAFAAVLALQSYGITVLEATVSVRKTHVIGYAIVLYEFIKLSLVILLVVFLNIGILGALTAIFIANCGWMAIYAFFLRDLWSEKVSYQYLKQWLKGSTLNFYAVGQALLGSLEGYILLFQSGNFALAFFGVAGVLTTPIAYTTSLSAALYPKLLTGGATEDVETAWKLTLLFAIPLAIAVIALSPSLLGILKVDYLPATMIVSILAIRSLAQSAGGIFDTVIGGTAKFDSKGHFTLREAAATRIFWSITVGYIAVAVYLPALWILLEPYKNQPLVAAEIVALAQILFTFAVLAPKAVLASRSIPLRFPWKSTLRFLLVSGSIASLTALVAQPLSLPFTILLFAAGAAVYFLVLYFVEEEVRALIEHVLERAGLILRSFHLFK